jgi:hypothetical protein
MTKHDAKNNYRERGDKTQQILEHDTKWNELRDSIYNSNIMKEWKYKRNYKRNLQKFSYVRVRLHGLSENGTLHRKETSKRYQESGCISRLADGIKILNFLVIYLWDILVLGIPNFSNHRNTWNVLIKKKFLEALRHLHSLKCSNLRRQASRTIYN